MNLSRNIEKHVAKLMSIWALAILLRCHWLRHVLLLTLWSDQAASLTTIDRLNRWMLHVRVSWLSKHTHDHRAGTMSALMLAQVVRSREFLATVGALERLLVSVERPVVTLEMFLASEAAAAERADESLGWIIRQRLLTATARDVGGCRWCWCG